jgi:hypothetical protein
MNPSGGLWRTAAAVLILAALVGLAAVLAPPYVRNWRLQQYLNSLAEDPSVSSQPPEQIASEVSREAARLGIALEASRVRVVIRGGRLSIRAPYLVRVEMPGYAVDLHFRPEAGGV